jgi:hypothetical protein
VDDGRGRAARGEIDENRARHVRRDCEEVGTVLPALAWLLLRQPHVSLMDESRGLHGVAGALTAQTPRRNPAQLGIDNFHQPRQRRGVAGGPIVQQPGDVVARLGRHEGARPFPLLR